MRNLGMQNLIVQIGISSGDTHTHTHKAVKSLMKKKKKKKVLKWFYSASENVALCCWLDSDSKQTMLDSYIELPVKWDNISQKEIQDN